MYLLIFFSMDSPHRVSRSIHLTQHKPKNNMKNSPQWSSHVCSNELLLEVNLAQQISQFWLIEIYIVYDEYLCRGTFEYSFHFHCCTLTTICIKSSDILRRKKSNISALFGERNTWYGASGFSPPPDTPQKSELIRHVIIRFDYLLKSNMRLICSICAFLSYYIIQLSLLI